MKIIRNFLKPIAFFLTTIILFVSCEQYDTSTVVLSEDIVPKYNGEEIFKGLFFFQNEISDNISELKVIKSKIESLDEDNNVKDSIEELAMISVSFINEKYPKYFDELQAVMYSGNLFEIENKMNLGAKLIEQSMLSSDKYSKIFRISEMVQKDPEIINKIQNMDLTDEKELLELKGLLTQLNQSGDVVENSLVFFAGAVAVFYVAAVAVSVVAAAYSVVTKVAYWDPIGYKTQLNQILTDDEPSILREMMILEIGAFFTLR